MLYEMIAGHPYFQAENGSKLDHLIRSYNRVLPLPEAFPQRCATFSDGLSIPISECAIKLPQNLRATCRPSVMAKRCPAQSMRRPRAE